jgi:uncharacterized membrane protein
MNKVRQGIKKIPPSVKAWVSDSANLFLLISVPAIMAFLVIIPTSWGLDEQMHTARVYQIADGGMYPDANQEEKRYGGVVSGNLIDAIYNGWLVSNEAERGMQFYDQARVDLSNKEHTAQLDNLPIEGEKEYFEFGPTGPYAPVLYLPAAVGMKMAMIADLSVGGAVFLARFMQAATYVSLVFMALRLLSRYRLQWLFFVVALLPASLYQAATLNADAVTNGFVMLFVAVVLMLCLQRTKMTKFQTWLLAGSSLALMFTKPSFAIFLVLLWIVPAARFVSKKRRLLLQLALPILCVVVFTVISIKGLSYSAASHVYFPAALAEQISLSGQIMYVLQHPIEFIVVFLKTVVMNSGEWHKSLIGLMGYNRVVTPYPMFLLASFVALLAVLNVDRFPRKILWSLLGVGIISILSIMFLLYGTFNKVGEVIIAGVQGRYFIPCILVLGVGIGGLLSGFIKVKVVRPYVVFALPSIVVVYSAVVAYYMAVF